MVFSHLAVVNIAYNFCLLFFDQNGAFERSHRERRPSGVGVGFSDVFHVVLLVKTDFHPREFC